MDNTSTALQARLEAVQAKQAEWQQEFDAVREDARQECLRLCKLFNFTTSDPENRGIYTQSDSSKKSSRNIWSLAVVSVDQRY